MNQTDPTAAIEVWARMLCAADVHVHGDDHPTWQQLVGDPGQRIRDDYRKAARWLLPRMTVATKPAAASAVVAPPTDRAGWLAAADAAEEVAVRLHNSGEPTRAHGAWDVMDALRRRAAEAHDTGTQQPTASTAPLAAGLPLVKGNCPACHRASLFLGSGGYVTCSVADCREPDAASTVLERDGAQQQPDTETPVDRAAIERAFAERLATELKGCCTECDACIEIAQHLAGSDQPATEAPKLPPMDPVHILGIHADVPASVAQQSAAEVRHTGGNAEDCPACIADGLNTLGYPWICPEGEQPAAADDEETP
ncbi:hypothetical protein [Streptomyces sp. NPDC008240]|uniref:hypothetical protein n=1 Tax=Streptomyces sp. NPDC008240 TaxID=3364822 RepID=UPI0036E2D87F